MGDTRGEPSMDHILASIKRIIDDDGAAVLGAARGRSQPAPPTPDPAPAADDVLELTEAVAADQPPAEAPEIVSAGTASASRQSLAALAAVVVRPDPDQGANTLEALVRELLRPMLKDWLDVHLPDMIERLVSREIARITGRTP